MRACRENIIFRALTADSSPDFTTIASFIRELKDEVKTIFTSVLLVCYDMELPGGTDFALDGCKMSSSDINCLAIKKVLNSRQYNASICIVNAKQVMVLPAYNIKLSVEFKYYECRPGVIGQSWCRAWLQALA